MEYTVLARKCRPQKFEDILGQESITRVLRNAIRKQRVAHAYIFSGPRGVGKTSTARILAKALNCKKGTSETSCNECPNCVEIGEGINMDVLEIDGASNRGIDNIRELRENVKFVPVNSPYKIYIIDEVHMLSKEAFNALLKTLEEPPKHIKFIFATTEPFRVPDTIMSRCQHFHFKLIPDVVIKERLADILEEEDLSFEEKAVDLISRSAEGSMRDAESILDKVITYCDGSITYTDAVDIIGVVDDEILLRISDAASSGDAGKALGFIEEVMKENKDAYKFVQNLLDFFRKILVEKLRKEDKNETHSHGPLNLAAEKYTEQQIIYILELILAVEGRIKNASSPYVYIEIMIVKMANSSSVVSIERIMKELHAMKKSLENMPDSTRAVIDDIKKETSLPEDIKKKQVIKPLLEQLQERWKEFLFVIEKKNKHILKTYLQEGRVSQISDNTVMLEFEESSVFHQDLLNQPTNIEFVEKELSSFFHTALKLKFKMVPDNIKKKPDGKADSKSFDPRAKIKKFINENDVMKDSLELFNGKIVGFKEPDKKTKKE
ncbi:MAG: DNA polymerase III subunit gamma/tau [Candidatus Aureabacteria bacterium]|nr:DNA polymerase III subunit gamma/tau [Candidatus Auribacterota bacterium]